MDAPLQVVQWLDSGFSIDKNGWKTEEQDYQSLFWGSGTEGHEHQHILQSCWYAHLEYHYARCTRKEQEWKTEEMEFQELEQVWFPNASPSGTRKETRL